jgi:hypothetical protein
MDTDTDTDLLYTSEDPGHLTKTKGLSLVHYSFNLAKKVSSCTIVVNKEFKVGQNFLKEGMGTIVYAN